MDFVFLLLPAPTISCWRIPVDVEDGIVKAQVFETELLVQERWVSPLLLDGEMLYEEAQFDDDVATLESLRERLERIEGLLQQ